MKYLIVNADDFGAGRGINRGVMEAHHRGILTSASLLVTTPWSHEAATLARAAPELSVGLHADLGLLISRQPVNLQQEARAELQRQFIRFQELRGLPPTHLDSHHNVHRDKKLLSVFLDLARHHGIPLREHSRVRYCSTFYGQWGGQTHLEQISPENLQRIIRTELEPGITELSCHPGYIDPDLLSGYSAEREAELAALCHPDVQQTLKEHEIELINYQELTRAHLTALSNAIVGANRSSFA